MKSFRISLRNVATIVACFAVALMSSAAMAQTFNYTDASGATCTYRYMNPNPGDEYAELIAVVGDFPASVTKWVLPEYVPYNNGTVRLGYFNEGEGWYSLPVNKTLTEIVFPKQMAGIIVGDVFDASESGSGLITLLALPRGGNVFLGWNDGNLDNPRVINVTSNVTFTAQFAACTNTAIESISAQASDLSVYPNPVGNILNIESDRDVRNGTLALFDLNGKVVARQTLTGRQAAINTQSLGKGIYILRLVEGGNASAGVKIVKQ